MATGTSAGALLSFALIILGQLTTANIILECLSLFYCNGRLPVCGSNGTHCWHAASDCERVSFNCLQLFQNDFDQVKQSYCNELIEGGIKSCCIMKECPERPKPVCGQYAELGQCRWFLNQCDMDNFSCESGRDYVKANGSLCKFSFGSDERNCTLPIESTLEKIQNFIIGKNKENQ